jgi:RNA polymerase sigma-70 factor (ECF subfamily)
MTNTATDITPQNLDIVLEKHRHELTVHCYRMLGSVQDAEDHVQEAFLRAWKRLDSYEGRASFRAWLYKIATNVCLDTLKKHKRRSLPVYTHPPANADEPFAPPLEEALWLEPLPDGYWHDVSANPEARYVTQESVRLAFMAALQLLPPRQRAVLLLRDVLDWRAEETAAALGMTVSAVNSALNRARKTLKTYDDGIRPLSQDDGADQTVLNRYLSYWEQADLNGLVNLLQQDVAFAMPPSPSWYQGRDSVSRFLANIIPQGRWRLLPTRANGQPAFGLYGQNPENGRFYPFAIQLLTLHAGKIQAINTFLQPQLFEKFALPPEIAP